MSHLYFYAVHFFDELYDFVEFQAFVLFWF